MFVVHRRRRNIVTPFYQGSFAEHFTDRAARLCIFQESTPIRPLERYEVELLGGYNQLPGYETHHELPSQPNYGYGDCWRTFVADRAVRRNLPPPLPLVSVD